MNLIEILKQLVNIWTSFLHDKDGVQEFTYLRVKLIELLRG